MMLTLKQSRKRLFSLWGIGAGILFILMYAQSLGGKFGVNHDLAWEWFLALTTPAFSLMIGAFVGNVRGRKKDEHEVDAFFYRFSLIVSVVFFLLILVTLLSQPLLEIPYGDILPKTEKPLFALQAFVVASLGAFFVRESQS